jgi:hypothetical protein
MQKSTTFITIFRLKTCHFYYDMQKNYKISIIFSGFKNVYYPNNWKVNIVKSFTSMKGKIKSYTKFINLKLFIICCGFVNDKDQFIERE